jgi:hypothetical protein
MTPETGTVEPEDTTVARQRLVKHIACIHCTGNVFTEPLKINDMEGHTQQGNVIIHLSICSKYVDQKRTVQVLSFFHSSPRSY